MLPRDDHSGVARGEIIRQIERVSFREDPAGGNWAGGREWVEGSWIEGREWGAGVAA